jgi:choline kinase
MTPPAAVILAAGIASRLRPLTDALPKPLLQVGGIPLLERTLAALCRNGLREVVMVTGYCHAMIEKTVATLHLPLDVRFVYNEAYATTNNNYSLWLTRPAMDGRAMLLLDADILFDSRILSTLLDAPHGNALVVRSGGHVGEEDVKVSCDAKGRIIRIGKEIAVASAFGESLGIEKFDGATTPLLFEALARRRERYEFYEASFQEIIDAGTTIRAVDSGGLACMEIDTPDDLAAADALALTMTP